jgi:hypothetical protein
MVKVFFFFTQVWVEILNQEEDNISYPFVEKEGKKDLKAMTLSKMIDLLTQENEIEPKFLDTFLMTYRSFTTPEGLISFLKTSFTQEIN